MRVRPAQCRSLKTPPRPTESAQSAAPSFGTGVIRHRALWPHRKTLSAMLGQSHSILTLSASVLAQNTDEKELVTRRAET